MSMNGGKKSPMKNKRPSGKTPTTAKKPVKRSMK